MSGQITTRCLTLVCLLICCGPSKDQPFVTDLPGSEERVRRYLDESLLQEAAWECIKLEQFERADSILAGLDSLLHATPEKIDRWGGKGIMTNYLLTFKNGVQGFFKVAGSDTLGPVRNELAAYEIDRLLRIHLTPITRIRDLKLPDGSTVRGVIKYFVPDAKTAEDLGLESSQKPDILIFFDTVIGNADRHLGNWMVRDSTKELFAIDHNRTFEFDQEWTWYKRMRTVRDPATLGTAYERYRTLPAAEFRNALSPHLSREQIIRFLECRSIIVRYLDGVLGNQTSVERTSRSAA